jgi:biopolymer transport protein ExbB
MSWLARGWEFMAAGGPVMWPLVALSLWLWALVLVKLLWLSAAGRERLDAHRALACLAGAEPPPPAAGPRGRAVAEFLALRCGRRPGDLRWWEVAVRRQRPAIWRHVAAVLVLAAVAPLLGLLGTVSGMIETFQVIRLFGTGNAQALSAGISEALITTQTGLLVAIPGLFAGWFLRRRARKLEQGLEAFSQAVERWLRSSEAA